MSKDGIAIRFSLKDVSVVGRNSKGVKLINLKGKNNTIVGVAKIYDESEAQEDRELTKEEFIEVTKEIEMTLPDDISNESNDSNDDENELE